MRLRQVLLNLLGNAVKFTAAGFIRLEVRANPPRAAGTRVHFEVRDSGHRHTAGEAAVIFEPFRQADGSITRKYGGTGLGLAISARLVEKWAGPDLGGERGGHGEASFHFTA